MKAHWYSQCWRKHIIAAGVGAIIAIASSTARAEPARTLVATGSASNRVDIVIVGDGYTAAQLPKYAEEVRAVAAQMFNDEPFHAYGSYFNVRYVEVVSAQSGADHPSRGLYVETALGASYDCAGIQRLICVNPTAVEDVLVRSVLPDQRDVVIVIVNDPEYGGSGGSVAVTSMHIDAVEIVLHELGHSFGLLADEYAGGGGACHNTVEPPEPNVTIQTDRSAIKWGAWIDPSTPIPSVTTDWGGPGLYEQGRYCSSGMYRPTPDSKMRSLGRPYEPVNTEQLVKRVYNLVSPIDQATPVAAAVTVTSGQRVEFEVQPQRPVTHLLQVLWFVDGQSIGTGTQYVLATETLTVGDHTVSVIVRDPTLLVRTDPSRVLEDSRSWVIRVSPATVPLVRVLTPNGGERLPSNATTTITWVASDPDGLQRFDVSVSTDGVQFNSVPACTGLTGGARSCTWTPTTATAHAWIRVAAVDRFGTVGEDGSDLPFSIVAQMPHAETVLQRLLWQLRAVKAAALRTHALETQLARAIAATQRGRTTAMCGELRAFAHHLEAASVRRVRTTAPLRTDTRAAIVTLGCRLSRLKP